MLSITPLGYGILSGLAAIALGVVLLVVGQSAQAISGGACFIAAGSIVAGAGVYRYVLLRR